MSVEATADRSPESERSKVIAGSTRACPRSASMSIPPYIYYRQRKVLLNILKKKCIGSRGITTIVVSAFVLLYLATLTADYYWDGITFALQVETVAKMERGASLLFHQNHLIYNAVGYAAYDLIRALSFPTRALYVMQIINVLAGAAAIGVFFRLAESLTRSRYAALISSVALAFAAVWWKLATDANAYVISILLMLTCAGLLLNARPRWLLAALALAGAMLVHQLASLFYVAALVAAITNPSIEKKWSFAAKFSAMAWGTTIAAYYLCASFVHGIKDPIAVVKWVISNPSGVSPSANPLHGLALLPRGNLDMVIGHSFALFRSQSGWVEKLFAMAAVVSAILCVVTFVRTVKFAEFLRSWVTVVPQACASWKACTPMLVTWIGVYVVFLLFWEPWQVLYRAFYLPPLFLALALLVSRYHSATRTSPSGAAAIAVATLAFFNLAFFVVPHMRTTANPLVAAARSMNHIWNEKTVIYFANRNEADTAFEYFNDQTDWRRFTAAAQSGIDDEIRHAAGERGQVWLNKGAAELVDRRSTPLVYGREVSVESPNAPARYVELPAK